MLLSTIISLVSITASANPCPSPESVKFISDAWNWYSYIYGLGEGGYTLIPPEGWTLSKDPNSIWPDHRTVINNNTGFLLSLVKFTFHLDENNNVVITQINCEYENSKSYEGFSISKNAVEEKTDKPKAYFINKGFYADDSEGKYYFFCYFQEGQTPYVW